MLKYLNLCFWFIGLSCLYAQEPATIHLTEKDGLPDIDFYNITEDSEKYIWLAANKGLYRYDGRSFDYYAHPEQKGNAVFGVKEDPQGRIWCNNVSGQFFFTENKKLKLFIDLGELLNGELTEFIVTEKELILISANIIRVNLITKKITKDFDKNFIIGAIKKTSDGYLFTKGNTLIKSNNSLKTIDSLTIDIFKNYTLNDGVKKRVLISSNDTINLYHFFRYNKNEFYIFNFSESTYNAVKIPKALEKREIIYTSFYKNQLWFSTDSGIYVCNLKNGALELQNTYFNGKFITKILKDSDTNYWVTTKGDGIYVIPNINIYQHNYPKESLNITNIEKIKRHFFVFGTTDGKVGLFNSKTNKFTLIDTGSVFRVSEIKRSAKLNETLIIKENSVHKINNNTLNYNEIKAPELQGAKKITVNGNNISYNVSSYDRAKVVNKNYEAENILVKKRSYTNHYSKNSDKLYVGTVDGFYVFDNKQHGQKIHFNEKPIFAKNVVETVNQKIWVSTFNDGLFCISNDKVISHFNTSNGLLSHRISALKSDSNYLWIATDEGIQYLNTLTNEFKNLTKQNGIPSYRISDIEIEEGKVFFANNTGIFSLDKEKAFKNTKTPKVYISDISIGLQSTELKTHYELDHNQNSIKISYNTNGFNSFLNYKYQFRLLGQNDTWQTDENKSNAVSYYSLPSGKYTFQVRSILADNNDKNAISSVSFLIKKPFWNQWWFYTLIALIVSIIIYLLFTSKIKKLKKEQEVALEKEQVNKQLVLSQLENLRSQMNPHFIFNALNSIQEYIVFNEKDLASSYLIKFSRLIRIYLDHSRESEVLLSEEIKALTIYLDLEKNRFEDVLDYKIETPDKLDTKKIKIPSLFIQPYVENALKHGLLHKKYNRKLLIDFRVDNTNDVLYCKIQDNGIGIKASRALNKERNPMHKSFATSANKKRVNLLNSSRKRKIKVVINSLSEGTEVLITIPI